MIVSVFLFYGVLIALVQGQVPAYRYHIHGNQAVSGRAVYNVSLPQAEEAGEEGQQVSVSVVNARPETWRDLLAINNVTNITGFISLLNTRDGHPVREEDLFTPDETPDGKRVIAGSGELMAVSDECSPRNMSVRLDLDVSDPGVAFYPECTLVERCGGCTPTPYLVCVPRYKEIVVLHVLKARYPFPGALRMEIEGFAPVRVERHLSCRATCTLKREDCGDQSIYMGDQCRCQCKRPTPCANNKRWNDDQCQCRCRNEVPCCGPRDVEGRRCPLFFDPVYCECTLKENVGGDPQASQAEMEAWLRSRSMGGRRPDNASQLFTVGPLPPVSTTHAPPATTTTAADTTTTTTSTPTTTPLTTQASCSHINCPRNMRRVMSGGRCLCRLAQGQRYRGRPRLRLG